jgi:hypothetical protein
VPSTIGVIAVMRMIFSFFSGSVLLDKVMLALLS